MGDFELDAVLEFMISKGGRVRNHELVTHFKNFLNHPNHKAQNREKFKDYVNELATIKLDESGEKVLLLKRKYRPNSDGYTSSASNLSTASSVSLSTTGGSVCPNLKTSNESAALPSVSDPNLLSSARHDGAAGAALKSPMKDINAFRQESPRAQSEPPNAPQSKPDNNIDTIDGGGMSRIKADDAMEVRMRHTDRMQPSASSSIASLASTDSQMSTTSATSGKTSTDEDNNISVISVKDKIKNLNKIHSETDLGRPARLENSQTGHHKKWTRPPGEDDDDASHSSSASYVTLNAEQREWMVVCSSSEYHDMNRLLSKNPGLAKLKDFTSGYTALHWGAKAGKAEVIKLVANKPGVNIDQRSNGGYTALHLAAMQGHEHIIELLVQTFKADANLRDYSGKKAKQYLKNSASSKAQQLLVSRRLGSDMHPIKSLDDSFIRSTSMRMSNRAKAISSLMQANSVVARQSLMRASWAGSNDDMREDSRDRPSKSVESSPASGRKNKSDMDLMPPPPNPMLARHMRHSERATSSSRENLYHSPRNRDKNDENQNFPRVESDTALRNKQGSYV